MKFCHCLTDENKIIKVGGLWFIYPTNRLCSMLSFVLNLTESNTVEEAHKKFSKILGYKVNEDFISPGLRSEKDAKKIIEHFLGKFDDVLFD